MRSQVSFTVKGNNIDKAYYGGGRLDLTDLVVVHLVLTVGVE